MRCFFALWPDPATALRIADWRDRRAPCDGRPVPPANFHITLAFAGELPERSVAALCDTVDAARGLADIPPGILELVRAGYWPRPGIYWLGSTGHPASLTRLATRLRELCTAVGGRRDRNRFQPHISLYRACAHPPPAPDLEPAIAFPYGHFGLFESRQGRSGISYRPLGEWELSGGQR